MKTKIVGVFLLVAGIFASRVVQAQEIQVVDAKLGTAVENREIVGADTAFAKDIEKVFCWMKISGGEGKQITVRWSYQNEQTDEVSLDLKYPTMRTYCNKTIAGREGDWKVEIVDPTGKVLKELHFTIR
jgi:hypothetical protein